MFVFVQTVRHRDYFLPLDARGEDEHATAPAPRGGGGRLGLLVGCLVAVVGLAKTVSPAIEDGVRAIDAPQAVVGVAIALLVLLPETLAAVRAALRNRVQTSLNLALGSALASIGLTIPSVAIASFFIDGQLVLGLGSTELGVAGAHRGHDDPHPGHRPGDSAAGHRALVTFAALLFLAVMP